MLPGLSSAIIANGSEVTVTNFTSANDGTNATTYTYAGLDFGPESPDRRIIVGCMARNSATAVRTLTAASCTIGGVTPTKPVELQIGGNDTCGMLIATVPTGTTGQTIFLTYNAGMNTSSIMVWSVTGLGSNTPTAVLSSSASPPTGTIDIVAGGIVIVAAGVLVGSSCTPTGYTERVDAVAEVLTYTGGEFTTPSAVTGRTITATFGTHTEPLMVAAAFGP